MECLDASRVKESEEVQLRLKGAVLCCGGYIESILSEVHCLSCHVMMFVISLSLIVHGKSKYLNLLIQRKQRVYQIIYLQRLDATMF
jgi:hypothetical protein